AVPPDTLASDPRVTFEPPPRIAERAPRARLLVPARMALDGASEKLLRPATIEPWLVQACSSPTTRLCEPVRSRSPGAPSPLYPLITLPGPFVAAPVAPAPEITCRFAPVTTTVLPSALIWIGRATSLPLQAGRSRRIPFFALQIWSARAGGL